MIHSPVSSAGLAAGFPLPANEVPMSSYYRLKTARPLPETYIPVKLTQPRGAELTSRVDEAMAWRSEDVYSPDQWVICVDTESIDADDHVLVDPVDPSDDRVVELDLEDPVVALQLLLRYREVFGDGSNLVRQFDILTSLIATDDASKARRAMFLRNLLIELDVPADAAKKEA